MEEAISQIAQHRHSVAHARIAKRDFHDDIGSEAIQCSDRSGENVVFGLFRVDLEKIYVFRSILLGPGVKRYRADGRFLCAQIRKPLARAKPILE